MSVIRAGNLARVYGSGTAPTTGCVVGVDNDPILAAPPAPLVALYAYTSPFYGNSWGTMVPVQWEVKCDDDSLALQVTWGPIIGSPAFIPAAGSVADNWINVRSREAYTQQKRSYEQEFGDITGSYDLPRMYVRGFGGACPFSFTIDLWLPARGA